MAWRDEQGPGDPGSARQREDQPGKTPGPYRALFDHTTIEDLANYDAASGLPGRTGLGIMCSDAPRAG